MLGSEKVKERLKDEQDIAFGLDGVYLVKEEISPHILFHSTQEEAWKSLRFKMQGFAGPSYKDSL